MPQSDLNTSSSGEPRLERSKVCDQCGTGFSCYTSNCWCDTLPNIVPLDPDKGCLCPACLQALIEQKTILYNNNL